MINESLFLNNFMKYFLLLLLLSSACCGKDCDPSADQPFVITFTQTPIKINPAGVSLANLEQAIAFWNYDKQLFEINQVDSLIDVVRTDELSVEGRDGEARYKDGKCLVRIRIDDWDTIAHELGHCLGLSHTDDVCSMMYKDEIRIPNLTDKIKAVLGRFR